MMSFRVLLSALACLVLSALPAAAQLDGAPKVNARLIAETDEIAPGGKVSVALEQDIRKGWHTYWQNPGEAGLPTTIGWSLPPGWEAGPIQWPYPKRLPAGPLMNYGYEGKPWLLVAIKAPDDAKPGSIVTLKGHASWLVCSETLCVPEDQDVSLPLKVSKTPAAPYPTIAQQFAEAHALLPVHSPWPARFHAGAALDLFVEAPKVVPRTATFFPLDEGFVKGRGEQELATTDGGFELRLAPDKKERAARKLEGVLVLTSPDGSSEALAISALPGHVPPARFAHDGARIGLPLALAFAFLGGLILNLMPCVLPILAMKALAVASKAGADKSEPPREGLAYGVGVILSFLVLGGAVLLLRAGGEAVGWGFQLQDPRVVAAFALLMFAVGLNLSGVFELPGITAGGELTRRGGAIGAFFTGMLAVGVAAPCTAPFMAAAVGFALTQSVCVALAVFVFLGLGFAAPFVAIGFSPALLRLLPKPGRWMLHFRQLLAFPMYGAAAWLVWVVAQEAGEVGLALVLTAMVIFAFAIWVWMATRNSGPAWRSVGACLAVASAVGALAAVGFTQSAAGPAALTPALHSGSALHAEAYSAPKLEQLRADGRPVFIDATAAWCITCLVNEKVALSTPDVAQAFARTRTAYLVADWTKHDSAITALLAAHGRYGVPLYLYYRPGASDAEVLPQVLTPDAVLAAVGGK